MLVNRVGDFGVALGIFCVFFTFKTLDYPTVFALVPCALDNYFSFLSFHFDRLTIISFLLFWGVVGKSAQIGLHIWLPDAMEGPTPVSALIHAATLVTAGVFLILRCSILFENSPKTLFVVSVVGALTAFFASSVALVQNDIKRVVAYSTCSQLGYMIFSSGLSYYSVALFHLANHAMFKALLFLSVGCIIHGLSDEQDMRKLGGLIQVFPVSYTLLLIGSFALMGFPFLTGFYSKDAILELALAKYNSLGNFAYFLGCCAAFCTSFYSFRLVWLTFINKTNSYKVYVERAHEGPFSMVFPLLVLSFGAIFGGFLLRDMMIGVGTPLFSGSLFTSHENLNAIDSEFLQAFIKNMPLIFSLFGVFLSFLLTNCFFFKDLIFSYKTNNFYKVFYTFLIQKWHFDQIVNDLIVIKTLYFGYCCSFQLFDKGIIELFGPRGISWQLSFFAKDFSCLQSGFLYHYSFVIMFSIIFFILFILFFFYNFLGCLNVLILFFCYSLVILNYVK
jgi:proton-translocating NADH-quinone oxidoreductase chain L